MPQVKMYSLIQCTLMHLFGETNSLKTKLKYTTMRTHPQYRLAPMNLQLTYSLKYSLQLISNTTIWIEQSDSQMLNAVSPQVQRSILRKVNLLLIHSHRIVISTRLILFTVNHQDGLLTRMRLKMLNLMFPSIHKNGLETSHSPLKKKFTCTEMCLWHHQIKRTQPM